MEQQATTGFETCFGIGSQYLGCRVPTVPSKTRLEPRFCNFQRSVNPIFAHALSHGDGACFHDNHHMANRGNFGSGLDLFDVAFGTRTYGVIHTS